MFSHRAYLKLGSPTETDYMSMVKEGYELADLDFSFEQGVNQNGKPSTKVYGGTLQLTIPMLPSKVITDWSLDYYQYKEGVIILFDEENNSQERIIFQNAACVGMEIDYTSTGSTYVYTKLTIHAEILKVGQQEVEFDNLWTK